MVTGVDPLIAALIGIAFGGLLGLINGVLAVGLRIPVIIITLGTLSVYRGLSLVVNESQAGRAARQVAARSSALGHQALRTHPQRRRSRSSSWRS